MSSSDNKNGEPQPIESLIEQRSFSLSEILRGEQWLVANGLLSDSTADQLLEFGYRVPGVEKVAFKLDTDEANRGTRPSLEYNVELARKASRQYRWVMFFASRTGIFSKLMLLLLLRLGYPVPGFYHVNIEEPLKVFLPGNYKINLNIR